MFEGNEKGADSTFWKFSGAEPCSYSDFLMLPDKARYTDIAHSYIMELKYVNPTATDAEVEAKSREADEQLKKYSADKVVQRLCTDTQLHLLKVVFRGAEMTVCEEFS